MKDMKSILNAILVLDNHAIMLRDNTEGMTFKERKKIFFDRKHIYYTVDNALKALARKDMIEVTGYYLQTVKDKSIKLYVNKIKGYDEEIYSHELYSKNSEKIECLGEMGLTQTREIDVEKNFNESRAFLLDYIRNPNDIKMNKEPEIVSDKKDMSSEKNTNDEKFEIKETKLVELHRLRLVKDIHVNGHPLNEETTMKKKKELKDYLDNNKGVYPKDQAILVWKDRDPKDRRKVVYNIEDGYRRYLISKELGLEKVYVNIIKE